MEEGLRLAGSVEMGGLHAPPIEERARRFKTRIQSLFPGLTSLAERIWMGFWASLPDSVPTIGAVPGRPDLFMAVGHGHYGMIGAPATGRLIAQLVRNAAPRPIIPESPTLRSQPESSGLSLDHSHGRAAHPTLQALCGLSAGNTAR